MVVNTLLFFCFFDAAGAAPRAHPRAAREFETPTSAPAPSIQPGSAQRPSPLLKASFVFSQAPAAEPLGSDAGDAPQPQRPDVTRQATREAGPRTSSKPGSSPYALYVSAGAGISWPLGIGGGASLLGSYELATGWCLGPYAAAATAGGTSGEMDSRLWLVHAGGQVGWSGSGERWAPLLLTSLGYGFARVHDRGEAEELYGASGPIASARLGMFSRKLRALSLLRLDVPLFLTHNEDGFGGARQVVMVAAEIGFRFGL